MTIGEKSRYNSQFPLIACTKRSPNFFCLAIPAFTDIGSPPYHFSSFCNIYKSAFVYMAYMNFNINSIKIYISIMILVLYNLYRMLTTIK